MKLIKPLEIEFVTCLGSKHRFNWDRPSETATVLQWMQIIGDSGIVIDLNNNVIKSRYIVYAREVK